MHHATRLAACAMVMVLIASGAFAQAVTAPATLHPVGDGPAVLDRVCSNLPTTYSVERLEVSSDGMMAAAAVRDGRYLVKVTTPCSGSAEVWADKLARGGVALRGAPVRWDSRVHELWAGLQETAARGGWNESPIRLARISVSGIEDLPSLDPKEGRLDAVRWIGDGLALVQLDTRGQYYRPVLPNSNPALGIIDARTGKLRARLDYASVEALGQRSVAVRIEGGVASATVLSNGKVRALLEADDWIVWTEGEQPRVITRPYPPSRTLHRGMYAMSPDGESFLVSALLYADGVFCETWDNRPCPPPTPATGVWAALHDTVTGGVIWQIEGAATRMGADYRAPEISPDGRLALIALPGAEPDLALVKMTDGAILQTFTGAENFGFIRDGTALWIDRGGSMSVYSLAN